LIQRIYLLSIAVFLSFPCGLSAHQLRLSHTSLSQGNTSDQLTTLFVTLEQSRRLLDGDIVIQGALSANLLLDDHRPFNYFTTLKRSNVLIESLSLDYYPADTVMLSFGRERMHLNLLNGSFDGLLAVGSFEDLLIKAYYFKQYAYLSAQLYENQSLDSLKGITLSYSHDWFDSELSYFDAEGEHRSDLYAAIINEGVKIGIEQMQFISSIRPDERAYKLNAGFRYRHFYIEGGYINVYEGGLNQIYAFGGSEFNSFGLMGFLDQQNAAKRYLDLHYRHASLYLKLHTGKTDFDIGTSSYTGKEYGMTFSYHYDPFHFTVKALSQKSNQAGAFGKRLSWIQTQLEYRF
jgi:hypothetical protein